MGPWQIATLCIVALAGLVAVVRLTRNPGTRAAPRRALDATPEGWGSMTLDPDPHAPSRALEAAHEDCWAGLPEWARPSYPRQAPFGWESGAGTAGPGGGWDDHPWDPWNPDPGSRLADTGDVMNARLATDVAAELHRQDADAELFIVGLAARARELAAMR